MRTSDDLKRKYETALSGKNKVKGMIDRLEEYLKALHTKVLTMIVKAQQSLRRLDEISLKPNPLTQIEYLELLIESEKNAAKEGWKQRVQYFEEAKHQAEILARVKDVKAAEKQIKEEASSGEKWYSRFKFWWLCYNTNCKVQMLLFAILLGTCYRLRWLMCTHISRLCSAEI